MSGKDISDFSEFEATLQKIDNILNNGDEEDESISTRKNKSPEFFENLDVDRVQLKVRENRTLINKREEDSSTGQTNTMDQQSFMQQVERDANERAQAKEQREYKAELQRSQGNEAFRIASYEKAIVHYTKALDQIKDSAITFNNRALCYIKLRNYKRALQDCEYVLDKVEKSSLRAWLYKATAHKRLNEMEEYEKSVTQARQHNPKQLAYIDKFISQMETNM
ncbi:tetratricopeptide repeat protein 12 [Drosophila tropicalis]|uniref:tetratricopeptide repeat protein 12 n=1 Tax=Drosophila tropicalis TaxID=46794 RepID=UPI0035ABB170